MTVWPTASYGLELRLAGCGANICAGRRHPRVLGPLRRTVHCVRGVHQQCLYCFRRVAGCLRWVCCCRFPLSQQCRPRSSLSTQGHEGSNARRRRHLGAAHVLLLLRRLLRVRPRTAGRWARGRPLRVRAPPPANLLPDRWRTGRPLAVFGWRRQSALDGTRAGRAAGGWLRRTVDGHDSHRRDCHFDDSPFLSLLKHLLKVEGGAAE